MRRFMTTALVIAAIAAAATPSSTNAQGLLGMVKEAAKKTSIGKSVVKLGSQAQLLDATTVNLDDKNLSQIQVGALKLGVSAIDIKNNEVVRLHLFLFNPAQTDVAVPLPPSDLFTFFDDKGRQLELLGDLGIKDLAAGATEITVPALERIEMSILYNGMAADARLGTLKVGSTGNITGIPINTGAAAATANSQGQANPWKK